MMLNSNMLVPMTDANQNFSKVVRMVDASGMAVILKNNKPRYVVVNFDEYDEIRSAKAAREKKILEMGDLLIDENMEAFKELAK